MDQNGCEEKKLPSDLIILNTAHWKTQKLLEGIFR